MTIKYYVVKHSSQSKEGKPFTWFEMYADLGYTRQRVATKASVIASLLGLSTMALYDTCHEVEIPYFVGDFKIDIKKAEVK